jgi:hypothetical protein
VFILLNAHSNEIKELCKWHWRYYEKKGVKVGVIRQQVEDAIALAPNGNIKKGIQVYVEVGETSATTNICRIEAKLQRTIDKIEDQKNYSSWARKCKWRC